MACCARAPPKAAPDPETFNWSNFGIAIGTRKTPRSPRIYPPPPLASRHGMVPGESARWASWVVGPVGPVRFKPSQHARVMPHGQGGEPGFFAPVGGRVGLLIRKPVGWGWGGGGVGGKGLG
jgi:hypothetical protein